MSKNERYLAKIQVSLKPTVNDPEGNTIAGALASLNFDGVQGVRAGKYFEVTIEASGKKKAAKLVDEMCARLLANPVIETYRFEIEGAGR
jgi:phosphoribosylformylglycinamidine synthase subunit PurS